MVDTYENVSKENFLMKKIIKKEKCGGAFVKRILCVVLAIAIVVALMPLSTATTYADNETQGQVKVFSDSFIGTTNTVNLKANGTATIQAKIGENDLGEGQSVSVEKKDGSDVATVSLGEDKVITVTASEEAQATETFVVTVMQGENEIGTAEFKVNVIAGYAVYFNDEEKEDATLMSFEEWQEAKETYDLTDGDCTISNETVEEDGEYYAYLVVNKSLAEETQGEIGTIDETVTEVTNANELTNAISNASSGATIKLKNNIMAHITIPAGKEIVLDLNGYVLNGGGNGIVITNNGTLTIKDSNTANQTNNFKVDSNGFWTLTSDAKTVDYDNITTYPANGDIVALRGGCITGGKVHFGSTSSGVKVDGGTLRLNSGNIVGNYAGAAPGVYVTNSGSCYMNGGRITGNMANNDGGGVKIDGGEFLLSGGDVSYNVGYSVGNGICVASSTSVLKMTGGSITGNHIHNDTDDKYYNDRKNNDYGGGVSLFNGAQMIMTGGGITKNISKSKGGGVGFLGTPSQITIGGTACISGNTQSDGTTASNVYLPSGTTVKVSEGTPLTTGAKIGVTTQTTPTSGNPVAITGANNTDYSSYFTSDNTSYSPVNDGNVVKLSVDAPSTTNNIELGTPNFTSATECTVPVTVTGGLKTFSISVSNAKLKLTSVNGDGYAFKNAVVSSTESHSTPNTSAVYTSVQLTATSEAAAKTALNSIRYSSITSGAEVTISANPVTLASGDYYLNGHYYTLNDSGAMSWKSAMEWAFNLQTNDSSRYPGYKSYPVVVTSEEENQMLVNIWNNGGGTHRQIFLPAVPVNPIGGSIAVTDSEGTITVTVTNDPYVSESMSSGHGEVYQWLTYTPEAGNRLPLETVKPYKFWDYIDPNPTNGGMVYFGHPGHGAYWDDLTEGTDNNWTRVISYDFTWHFCALAEWEPTDSAALIVKTRSLAPHTHGSWTYSVGIGEDANKLTATCGSSVGGYCTLTDKKVSLTLNATSPIYSGNAATISIGTDSERTAWTTAGLTLPEQSAIKYYVSTGENSTTESGAVLASAPTTAGYYVAELTVEEKTAKVAFTISKVDPTVSTAPTAKTLTYTGSAQELVTAGSTSDGTLQYALSSVGPFSNDIPKATNAGTYEIYYKVVGNSEHNDKVFSSTPVSVTISKGSYSGTTTATGNILAGSASSDVEVTLPTIPDHMSYGTPTYSTTITGATVVNGKVKFSTNSSAVAATNYTITVPVNEKSGEKANFNNYDISVTLTGVDYTISYNTNGGSIVPNATHQSTIVFPSSNPTKSGYNFAGWYTDSACTNKAVEGTVLVADITLYAKWTAVPKKDDSGSNPDPEPSTPSSPSTPTYIPPVATEPTTPVAPPTYVAPEKEVVISIPVETPGGVIKNVSVHKDGTVQEATPVPPARIVTYNEVCNPAAPTAVTAVNILVDKVSAETTAKVEDVTAEVNVKTIQGNINVSPKLVSGLKEEAVSSVGKKAAKNLDIKINTTAANGKAVIATVSAAALKNNAVLDAYIIDPVTGSYVFSNAPSAKYNKKTGLTITGLIGGFEYVYVPESEAKKIDQYIMNTVKISDQFAKPVQSVPGASIDMTKALSSGLCLANIQKVEYAVSGNRATINPLTGQLAINPDAKKGTITVTMKITLMNGKTKILKTRIKI